jgi:hypothetical protein
VRPLLPVLRASGRTYSKRISSHAVKKEVRYRNYVSRVILAGRAPAGAGQRIPALSLEGLVRAKLVELLGNPTAILQRLGMDADGGRGCARGGRRPLLCNSAHPARIP